eukprot:1014152-Prymnesium_polylepis.2
MRRVRRGPVNVEGAPASPAIEQQSTVYCTHYTLRCTVESADRNERPASTHRAARAHRTAQAPCTSPRPLPGIPPAVLRTHPRVHVLRLRYQVARPSPVPRLIMPVDV